MNLMDISAIDLSLNQKQKEFFNSIESSLTNNYELVKQEFKSDLVEIFNNINELKENQDGGKINGSISTKFDEISGQFDQFGFVLKSISEKLANQENKPNENQELISILNEKFDSLARNLKDENSKFNSLMSKKAYKRSKNLESKIKHNFNDINEKLNNFIETTRQEQLNLENQQLNTINAVIEANNLNKKEILERISSLENQNVDFLNDKELEKIANENSRLRELEHLINLQNEEMQALLSEKNEFINDIEKTLIEKKENLSDERINEIQNSINNVIDIFNEKIENLEWNLGKKINETQYQDNSVSDDEKEKEFAKILETRLTNNYELIKNELRVDLVEISNNINNLREDYNNLSKLNKNNNIDEIDNHFEQFRFLLKNISEKIIQQDGNGKDEIVSLRKELDDQYNSLIKKIEDENNKNSKKILNKLSKVSKNLSKKINHNIDAVNSKIDSIEENIKSYSLGLFEQSVESIKNIVSNNNFNKNEIVNIINAIDEERREANLGYSLEFIDNQNSKLMELEKLIDIQNNEIISLMKEKNEIITEIDNIISNNKNSLKEEERKKELNEALENISTRFENKINALEQNFSDKLNFITFDNNSEILTEKINQIEVNLVENYGFLREDMRNIFIDLSNKIQAVSLIMENNNTHNEDEILETLSNEIKELKELSNSIMSEVQENSNKILKIENVLEKELSAFISDQKETFENIEKILINNPNDVSEEKLKELEKWYSTMHELIDSHSDFSDYVVNKIEDIECSIKKLVDTNPKEVMNTLIDIDEKISRHEEIISTLQKSATQSFNEIKNTLLEKLDENALLNSNSLDMDSLVSVTSKLNQLEELLMLQDEQTSLLISEKDELMNKVDQLGNKSNIPSNEIGKIIDQSNNLNNKLDILYENVSKDLIEMVNLYKTNAVKDTNIISNKIDSLIENTNTNISIINKRNLQIPNSNCEDKIETLKNNLMNIKNRILSLNGFDLNEANYKEFNEELDSIKKNILQCDFDLFSIKEYAYENKFDNFDQRSVNLEKISLVNDLINHNKQYLNNIVNQKNEIVGLLSDNNLFENNFIESKASYFVDKLSSKLFEKQTKEYNILNRKIDDLMNRLNILSGGNTEGSQDYNVISQVEKLEKEIINSFEIVDEKKKEIMKILSPNIEENSNDIENIIEKFESQKESIIKEYEDELVSFKNEILNIESEKINNYKEEVQKIETEISSLKESKTTNENSGQIKKDFEPLETLVEELNLEITSFELEKENLYKEISEKIRYLNSLESPSDSNNMETAINTNKFKYSLNDEAKKIIEDEFKSFEAEFKKNLMMVKRGLKNIKSVYENEIDNPSWFKTFNDKLESIEQSLLSSKEEKEKNFNETENNHLKLTNDSLEINDDNDIVLLVRDQENRKKEIEDFYKKIRDLENLWKDK